MLNYVTLPHNKKLNLLRAHSLGCDWPNLDQEHGCLHCRQKFDGHLVRVWQSEDGRLRLECGTPGCDGLPIDWAPYPWWRSKHPAPKTYRTQQKKTGAKGRHKPGIGEDIPF